MSEGLPESLVTVIADRGEARSAPRTAAGAQAARRGWQRLPRELGEALQRVGGESQRRRWR